MRSSCSIANGPIADCHDCDSDAPHGESAEQQEKNSAQHLPGGVAARYIAFQVTRGEKRLINTDIADGGR